MLGCGWCVQLDQGPKIGIVIVFLFLFPISGVLDHECTYFGAEVLTRLGYALDVIALT